MSGMFETIYRMQRHGCLQHEHKFHYIRIYSHSQLTLKNNIYFRNMIKQSFLRNYNLAKIHSQANDEKKMLEVFYFRQVQRIIKQRRQIDIQSSRQTASKQHQAERMRLREMAREMKENRGGLEKPGFGKSNGDEKNGEQTGLNQNRKKAELFIAELELKSCLKNEDQNHQSLKITNVPNRNFHIKMLNSTMAKLQSQNGLHIEQHHHKHTHRQKLPKRSPRQKIKYKITPPFIDSSEKCYLDGQMHKVATARRGSKIRIKRNENQRLLTKRRSWKSMIGNVQFNQKFVSELKSRGIITQQNEYSQVAVG